MMSNGSIEAYAFVSGHEDPGGFAHQMLGVEGVRFASPAVGSFDALLAVETHDLGDLQDRIAPAALAAGPSLVQWSLVAIDTVALLPKRRRTLFCAFIRLLAERPVEVVDALHDGFSGLNDRDGYGFGAAVVTGRALDVLIDLGAPSFDETMELVFAAREIDGVGRTDTTVAAPPEDAWAKGA